MATYKEIKKELEDAKEEHRKADEELKQWKGGCGERLNNLKRGREKEEYEGEKEELIKKEEGLMADKKDRLKQV